MLYDLEKMISKFTLPGYLEVLFPMDLNGGNFMVTPETGRRLLRETFDTTRCRFYHQHTILTNPEWGDVKIYFVNTKKG